ncbi:MAG: hypothetical protein K2O67_01520, partial [Clostridia bacterium]|nr:hypothetical protein [Clostridia bacterium]
LTYILVPQNGALDVIPQEILNASLVAEVMLSKTDEVFHEEIEPKILAHEDFVSLLNETKEVSFVSEKIWKKVDELAELIGGNERFAIGNKNTIQMESFTSVVIDCGAEEPEAVTHMFLSKLAYILKNTLTYRKDGGEKAVFTMIEKLFADEELTKIKRVLTKTVATVQPQAEETKPEESAEAASPETAPEEEAQPEAVEEPEATETQTETAEAVDEEQPEQPEQAPEVSEQVRPEQLPEDDGEEEQE